MSVFRQGDKHVRVINMCDANGNRTSDRWWGSMEIIRHESILKVLYNHSKRFRGVGKLSTVDDHLVSWALDETGTVDKTILLDSSKENIEQQQEVKRMEKIRVWEAGVPDEVLQVHGTAPKSKGAGVTRLIYKNVNGFSNRLSNNEKIKRAKEIHDKLEVDIVAYNEHRLNMNHKLNVNGFNQLFRGGEAEIRSMVSHNVHENIGRIQEGGVSLIMYGPLTEYLQHDVSAKDEKGLGRWSVMTQCGGGIRTRIVCGYNPCYNRNPDSSTTYQQHRRYFRVGKDDRCPRAIFKNDLISMLTK